MYDVKEYLRKLRIGNFLNLTCLCSVMGLLNLHISDVLDISCSMQGEFKVVYKI